MRGREGGKEEYRRAVVAGDLKRLTDGPAPSTVANEYSETRENCGERGALSLSLCPG